MKKNVYLVQVSAVYGESVKTAYLPYAAGCLAAYAWADDRIRENYSLGRFIFIREDIDEAIASMDEPYLVGFSSYIWNMEYNKLFALKLRERYPKVIIVFGGHNIAPDGSDLEKFPQADIVMHGEGEESFRELLLALQDANGLDKVNNISYRNESGVVTTPYRVPQSIEDYPSPYLEGYFDSIIRNSGIEPSIIWETNRGCPNRCAFCDWGALKSKIRMFPMQRVVAELEWMVKNKVEYVYCADANFGLFSRDTEIADMIIESKKKFGYPAVFKTNYTKNKDDVVFEISKKLIENGIGKSPTLSFQSLSEQVLCNIGRSNMELEHFKSLMARYSAANVPVYSELILGLPGESYESFTDGICKLLECNQHTAIGIYPCELLPNSLMGAADYRERFQIKTVRTAFAQYHIKLNEQDVHEYSNIVISTSTMSVEDWKRSFIFSICVQTFHNLGLTRAIAIYLFERCGMSYKDFYSALIGWLDNCGADTVCGKAYARLRELTDGVVNAANSFSCVYGDDEKITWSFEEFLFIYLAKNADGFYSELMDFIGGYDADRDEISDLLVYQQAIIKKPRTQRVRIELKYDFYNYFQRIYADCSKPLEKRANVICVEDRAVDSWDESARFNVWYGRRDDAQLYTGKKNTVVVKYK